MSRSLDAARSFLEQLEALGGRDGVVFAGEFSDIRAHSAAWKTESVCSTEAGSRPENLRKNRYKDVLPYDQTRVILSLLQEEGHGDYINGNFIRGADGSQAYIATQGPLPHTLLDFWRLIWEFGVKVSFGGRGGVASILGPPLALITAPPKLILLPYPYV